ncbi:hypothetical protein ABH940_007398, partial [Streptacidiphilus sp. BW17]
DKRQPLLPEDRLGPVPAGASPLSETEHAANNLPDVLARWRRHNGSELERARTERSFCVPKGDIVANGYDLSLSRYKEVVHEVVEYRSPQEIMDELARIESDIQQGMSALKGML